MADSYSLPPPGKPKRWPKQNAMPADGHIVWPDNCPRRKRRIGLPAGRPAGLSVPEPRESIVWLTQRRLLRRSDLHADRTAELAFFSSLPRVPGNISLTFRFAVTGQAGFLIEQWEQDANSFPIIGNF